MLSETTVMTTVMINMSSLSRFKSGVALKVLPDLQVEQELKRCGSSRCMSQ